MYFIWWTLALHGKKKMNLQRPYREIRENNMTPEAWSQAEGTFQEENKYVIVT